MLALRRIHDPDLALPFRSAEEAWLWTMEALLARRDGAGAAWRPDGPPRPCDPDDIVRAWISCIASAASSCCTPGSCGFGANGSAPRAATGLQHSDWRLWHQALGQLEWALRARGIVR